MERLWVSRTIDIYLKRVLQLLLILSFLTFPPILFQSVWAAQIQLAWYPNTEMDLAGYKVYYGTASRSYGEPITLDRVTTYTLTDLVQGQTYFIALTAYDTSNHESRYSDEVSGIAHEVSHDFLYGAWDFKISGADRGGATLSFEDDHTFKGYGISTQLDFFQMDGTYSIDAGGSIHGVYSFYDFFNSGSSLGTGNITGKKDRTGTKLTFTPDSSSGNQSPMNMKGTRPIQDPVIPGNWRVKVSGSIKGTLNPFVVGPFRFQSEAYPHLSEISGTGLTPDRASFAMNGYFFLTPGNMVFGSYEISGSIADTGIFSGRLTLFSGRFNLSAVRDTGGRFTLSGQIQP